VISPHLHCPEISLETRWGDALWEVRHRVNGSDSDSSFQCFSFSDVVRGMEEEQDGHTRRGLLSPGGRRFADYGRCEGSHIREDV